MRLETFFDNFELLADAPNGVQKLRELILQLAIKGQLVPQQQNDEPASVLLKKIKAEKERLIKEQKIRRLKPLPPVESDKIPFELPKTWEWIRFGEIGDWGAGATPNRSNSGYYGGLIRWFKSGELNDAYIRDSEESITELALQECSLRLNKPGDVLIAMYGATIGKVAILETDATTNQAVCACTCFEGFYNYYLFLLLKAYKKTFSNQGAGGAQPNISREKIIHTVAPLPPLEEQKRIVAKVDQLMALCDQLDARQRHRRESRVLLNNAALDQLLTTREPDAFAKHWQRICDNFDLLYSAPENIGKLRQAILQLAVQGKLVPQDPRDEPASVLLEKIKVEKEWLMKEGKIRKSEPLPTIKANEVANDLPSSWAYVRLGKCIELISGQHLGKDEQNEKAKGLPYLTGPSDFGEINPKATRWTSTLKAISEKNDILITVKGAGVGKTNILGLDKAVIGRQIMAIRPIFIDHIYIYLWVLASYERFQSLSIGSTVPGISREDILHFILGIPPIEEQKRIVAKVNQLMALCDELETKLTQSQTDSETLMDAAVRQVLVA